MVTPANLLSSYPYIAEINQDSHCLLSFICSHNSKGQVYWQLWMFLWMSAAMLKCSLWIHRCWCITPAGTSLGWQLPQVLSQVVCNSLRWLDVILVWIVFVPAAECYWRGWCNNWAHFIHAIWQPHVEEFHSVLIDTQHPFKVLMISFCILDAAWGQLHVSGQWSLWGLHLKGHRSYMHRLTVCLFSSKEPALMRLLLWALKLLTLCLKPSHHLWFLNLNGWGISQLMSFVSWVILAFSVTFGASLNLHAEYCVH